MFKTCIETALIYFENVPITSFSVKDECIFHCVYHQTCYSFFVLDLFVLAFLPIPYIHFIPVGISQNPVTYSVSKGGEFDKIGNVWYDWLQVCY